MPFPVGGSGACPRKKINFALKDYAILSKFWYFFPILQQKVGGLSPSPESGGTYPPAPPPCSDAYVILAAYRQTSGTPPLRRKNYWI